MITYPDICRANEGLKGIDVKGKNYIMVNERVKAFRRLLPDGFIITDILSLDDGVCVMKTRAGYYKDGHEQVLATGTAFEKQDSSYLNKTSYIENCETSSVGRCLSFLNLGSDDAIASAEELANAIMNQEKPTKRKAAKDAPAEVQAAGMVPAKTDGAVNEYIKRNIKTMQEVFGIDDYGKMVERFQEMRQGLIDGGVIPDVSSREQTMEQAVNMIEAIYANFRPSGEKI